MDPQGINLSLWLDSTGSSQYPPGFDFEDFTAFEGGAPPSAFSSPANPAFDLSSSVHSSNMGTVSPQDLLMNEPFMSAPNSTAFTNLTSPSIYDESPDFNDSLDVSPSFDGSKLDGSDTWFSLFPDAQQNQAPAPAVDQSPATPSEELDVEKPTQRRKSSNASSPSGRHSSVSGVGARRRDKPLPPIIVEDPNDTIAMKRARNTLAARKSRERKAQRFEDLEEKIRKLEAERDHWKQLALASGAQ
ncbi:Cross-pathway control protein 1 [Cytospora mali]|uniref:Cross-pathway control protein 1 n=1 Tax=Cytospora mali TaxID=578113 RepID=A0A194UN56_CYTMA|nr:Cross-pathway control protein 1 [Valsa mali var. pyri (nom. inval.)]